MSILPRLRRLGLQTPVAILIETYRPLESMLGALVLAVAPLAPGDAVRGIGETLSDSSRMDQIVQSLTANDSVIPSHSEKPIS